ncbi:MAG: hypothetical protein RL747_1297 [Bacteroidota bacterium]
MLARRQSILAMLLMLLSLMLLFQYGIPNWFGAKVRWAILPMNTHNLTGVFLGAFVHGSWDHLWGNVIALSIFSGLFMIQFPTQWLRFWFLQHMMASVILWFIGNIGMDAHHTETAHIGASIWVYAFGGFILTMGVIQRTKQSMAIFFLVLLMFGGFFWGLLPVDPKVSWQGHLSGLITGVSIAFWKGIKWLPPTQELMDDSEVFGDDEGEIEDPYQNL